MSSFWGTIGTAFVQFLSAIRTVLANTWTFLTSNKTQIAKVLAIPFVVGIIVIIVLIYNKIIKLKKKEKDQTNPRDKPKKFNIGNPFGKKAYNGLPRGEETAGRCDNAQYISAGGVCINTTFVAPPPKILTIDPTKIYDYNILPYKVKEQIRNNPNKLSIKVPYKYNQTPSAFILDFENAKFLDGTSAGYMFDNSSFDTWKFKELTVTGYKSRERYLPTNKDKYKGLDSFVKS